LIVRVEEDGIAVKRNRLACVTGSAAVALGIALTGCGSSTTAGSSSPSPTTESGKTFGDYLSANHITKEAPKIGAAGVPTVTPPELTGWSPADSVPIDGVTPVLSVKYDGSATGVGIAIVQVAMMKLTGNIDQNGLLAAVKQDCSNFGSTVPDGAKLRADPTALSISGFTGWQVIADAIDKGGKKTVLAVGEVIIPGKDATYLLPVSGAASPELEGTMLDAVHLVETKTTIQP